MKSQIANGETLEATTTQRFRLAQMFQQLLKEDPMVKKIGGNTSGLLLEAVRFQFEHLPLKPKIVTRKVEAAALDEEDWPEEEFYVFRFRWSHPIIEYSTEIVKELPVKDFEGI